VWAPPKTTPPSLAMGRETQEIALAVVADSLPVAVELGAGQTWPAAPGGKVEIPVKVVRRGNFKEALALTIADPPMGVKAQALTIAADKSEGKLTLEVDKKTNLGTFSFNLHAQAKVSYRRGEALAKAATETKQQIEKLATDLNTSVQQAEKDRQAAVQAAQAADVAAKQAPEPKRADAQAEAKAANERKSQAERHVAELNAQLKNVSAAKAAAEKRANDLTAASAPKDLTIVIASTVARVNVAPAPEPPKKTPEEKKAK
jgi:hypothetical protein